MQININKEKFSDIENAFTRLKANDSDVSAMRKISDSLRSITGKNISVNVIKPTSINSDCVVMSVYPDESTIDQLISAVLSEGTDAVVAKIWNDTTSWNIEIDARILSDKVNLTEKELTALLMHEIGHIIASNTVPMRFAKVVRLEYAKTDMVQKQLLKDSFLSKLLLFPILNACNFNKNKASMKNEVNADKFSIQSGYGKDLISAMDKIMIYAGSSNTTDDDDAKSLMGFTVDSLTMLQNRQNTAVRKNMMHMFNSTPSLFARKMIRPLVIGVHGGELNGGSIAESSKDEYLHNKIQKITDEFYASEAFFNRIHKLKKIDPLDIDYIGLEVNGIKSNDDKMMIVSYIYNKLDTIDYYISLIDSKNPNYVIPHSKESLIQMRERLNKYRMDAIDRKLPDISYGINIQYPIGYEG